MIFTASFFIVVEVNMREIKNYDIRFGEVSCILKKEMDRQNISISKMSRLAKLKYDVVKRYYIGDLYHVDLEILAKFCYVLECNLSDILVYEKQFINERLTDKYYKPFSFFI